MPKEKQVTKLLPRMYHWNIENLGLYFFVQAQFQIVPTVTLDQALKNYVRFMRFTNEEWDFESLRSTYARLQKEFYQDLKNENTNKDC